MMSSRHDSMNCTDPNWNNLSSHGVIITFMMDSKRFLESHGYTFKSNLGEGMYGKVVTAHSTRLKRRVAIKIVDKKKAKVSYVERFLSREIEIIKSLNHPNIVKTHEIFESRTSKVYMVMDLCVKGDLLKHINANGALSEHASCRLFTQLCEAVQYLHGIDVAHRDLKCENLLLDRHENIKVGDFGFSKRLAYADGKMVLSETFCGTSSYAAPEILKSLPYNPKVSDVWSMGVVLYMMLHAAAPYESTNVRRMVGVQMQHNVTFPNVPNVSSEAKDLIRSILHPAVEQRITVNGILQSLWILQEHSIEGSTPDSDEQDRPPDKNTKDNSDPGEGPSTAAPRQ